MSLNSPRRQKFGGSPWGHCDSLDFPSPHLLEERLNSPCPSPSSLLTNSVGLLLAKLCALKTSSPPPRYSSQITFCSPSVSCHCAFYCHCRCCHHVTIVPSIAVALPSHCPSSLLLGCHHAIHSLCHCTVHPCCRHAAVACLCWCCC